MPVLTPEQQQAQAQSQGLASALAGAPAPAAPTLNWRAATPQAQTDQETATAIGGTGVKVREDGKTVIVGGPYNGFTMDEAMLQLRADNDMKNFKGMALPPGSYKANPDGSITIVGKIADGPWVNTPMGTTIGTDGTVKGPDGVQRTNPDGSPMLSPITSQGQKTSAWQHDNGITTALNAVENVATANPFGGQAAAAVDLAQGKGRAAENDIVNGFSGGVVGTDANGNLTPGSIAGPIGAAAGDALGGLGLDLGLGGGSPLDTAGADAETARANALADVLGGEREKAGAQADTDRGLGLQTREQQQAAIQQLQDAASGKVPSAAELALTRQSGIDAARQQGLAAALQGSNPAAALRQASMGAAKVAGDTAANAAQLRAKEQADARTALANTLSGVRTGDQSAVNTDVNQQGNAQTGQVASQGQGVTMTAAQLQAQAEKDKADAQREGAAIGAIGALGTGILTKSDRRAKKDVAKTGLADALAKGVHGVTFEYEEPEDDREEGPQFGVLAQELERVIPGAVKRRGDGLRMVDAGHMTMANTAILAELAKRLIALEGKGGKRK